MESRERREVDGNRAVESAASGKARPASKMPHRGSGREERSGNRESLEAARDRARMNYRRQHPKNPSKVAKGLLVDGEQKEVIAMSTGAIMYVEAYPLSKAAEALGKSRSTINKWVSDGIIPPPCIMLHTGNRVMYAREELQSIADVLKEHEKEYDFLHTTHTVTINNIWQRLEALRRRKGFMPSEDENA